MALQNIKVNDLVELKECVAAFGRGVLFRGQTQHYGTADQPTATKSFDRHGYIPPRCFGGLAMPRSWLPSRASM